MKVVGITSCPSGVAHTYMAAEALKLSGEKLGMEVLIETQGGAGVENQLKQKDIDEAVCVVLVNDVALEGLDRFKGKKVLKMGVSDLIKKSDAVMKEDSRFFPVKFPVGFPVHSGKMEFRGAYKNTI
ncbi:MAG: PTS fructose transporter subunit IIB [Enterocloster sp.]